ncbi:MAG: FlgD immunoglobulin-like domain containing protein [Armatimonadota bacterium]
MTIRVPHTLTLFLIAVLALGTLSLPSWGIYALQMSNQVGYVSINDDPTIDNVGSWAFGMTGGDPQITADDGLEFIQWTLAFLYVADADEELLLGDGGRMLVDPYFDASRQMGGFTWSSDDPENMFTVECRLYLIRDVLRWQYRITNNNGMTKDVAFRLACDIDYAGDYGGPYYLPGQIKSQLVQEWTNSNVPTDWFIRFTPWWIDPADIGYRPLLMAQQSLKTNVSRPCRFAFGTDEECSSYTWTTVREAELPENQGQPPHMSIGTDYTTQFSFGNVAFYPLAPLAAGDTRVITGEFRCNWAQTSLLSQASLAVTAPAWVGFVPGDDPLTPDVETGYYTGDAKIRAYVDNASLIVNPAVTVTIDPGDGLELVIGQQAVYNVQLTGLQSKLASALPTDTYSWRLRPTGTKTGTIPVRVTASFSPGGTTSSVFYINVAALPQHRYNSAGHYMTGFPFSFTDPDAVNALGQGPWVRLAEYDPDEGIYHYASAEPVYLQPGLGYWLKFDAPTEVSLIGASPLPQRETYRVSLKAGWNIISNPYQFSIVWGKCIVYVGDTPYTINEAVNRRLIRRELWGWDPVNLQYYQPPVNPSPANGIWLELRPYEGYWLYTGQALDLIFQPNLFVPAMDPDTPTARTTPRRGGSANDWSVNIQVQAGNVKDTLNTFGVAPNELDGLSDGDVMEPPMSPEGLASYFPQPLWGRSAGNYGVMLQAPGSTKSWDFEVNCQKPNEVVILRWPDLTRLPANMPLLLTDQLTGKAIYMRTVSQYNFNSGEGGIRRFTITAGGSIQRLTLTQARVVSSRAGSGVTISYGVSIPAEVNAAFRTQTGRLVRVVTPVRSAAGTSLLTWDGRDQQGRLLPRGSYVCELSAVADDGQRVRAMLQVPKR